MAAAAFAGACSNEDSGIERLGGRGGAITIDQGDKRADLALMDASVSTTTPKVGEEVTLDLVGRNLGPDSADNATLTVIFPSGNVANVTGSADRDGACSAVTAGFECRIPLLGVANPAATPGSDDWRMQLRFTPTVGGPLTLTARIASDILDTTEENNERSLTLEVPPPANVDLYVRVTTPSDSVSVGDTLTYDVTVGNRGPRAAQGVTLEQVFTGAPGFDITSATSLDGSCSVNGVVVACAMNELAAGAEVHVAVTLVPTSVGLLKGDFHVDSPSLDANEHDNVTSITTEVTSAKSADMGVEIFDSPDPVSAGSELTYAVIVTNHGPQTAHNVVLDFVGGAGFDHASTATPGCEQVGPARFHCEWAELVNGQRQQVEIRGLATGEEAVIVAWAHAAADEDDNNERNNTDSEETAVTGAIGVDLATHIADDPDPVRAGDQFTYLVTWSNAGTSTSQHSVAHFVLPAEVTFASKVLEGVAAGEHCELDAGGRIITCEFLEFPPSRAIVLRVVVDTAAPTGAPEGQSSVTVTASGSIDSDEQDAVEENDSDVEDTTIIACRTSNPCVSAELGLVDGELACIFPPNDGVQCDAPCYGTGVCEGGSCQLGAPVVCDAPAGECQVSACNPSTGQCEVRDADDGSACQGDDLCLTGKTCQAGQCVGGAPTSCQQDDDPCTLDVCNPANGACEPTFTTEACDDGNSCTTYDRCQEGVCHGGPTLTCDDGNVCTTDSCNPDAPAGTNPCVFDLNSDPCDDGNPCTTASACNPLNGACQATAVVDCSAFSSACQEGVCDASSGECYGAPVSDGVPCDDGDACTGTCDTEAEYYGPSKTYQMTDARPLNLAEMAHAVWIPGFFCGAGARNAIVYMGLEPGATVVVDANHNATVSGVVKVTGTGGGPGELGMRFSLNASFHYRGKGTAGVGSGGFKLLLGPLQTPNAYFDWEFYDMTSGTMVNLANASDVVTMTQRPANSVYPMQLGYSANGKDLNFGASVWFDYVRTGGACSSSGIADLWVDLTLPGCGGMDRCEAGQCVGGTPVDCDDGDACTTNSCDPATGCQAAPVTCDDGDACTSDSCDPATGCATTPITCDDGDACTTDGCDPASGCTTSPVVCEDDDNPCTTDRCDAELGCVYEPNTDACDDGDACTVGDVCGGGSCHAGAGTLDCASDGQCTRGYCDAQQGCMVENLADGTACDDGDLCTGGPCLLDAPGVTEVWEVTNADKDPAVYSGSADHALWFIGLYGGTEKSNLTFEPGDAHFVVYDDGSAHLVGTGYISSIVGGTGTLGESWSVDIGFQYRGVGPAGQGSGGPKKELHAGTQGTTVTDQWEYYDFLSGSSFMTSLDRNALVVFLERPMGGIYPLQVGNTANGKNLHFGAAAWFTWTMGARQGDGDVNVDLNAYVCGAGDTCQSGQCAAGDEVICRDDGNPCTTEYCDPAAGCVSEDNDDACDDGDACTVGDMCGAGGCLAGSEALDCDDGDECTTDSCDPAIGCVHEAIPNCGLCPVCVGVSSLTLKVTGGSGRDQNETIRVRKNSSSGDVLWIGSVATGATFSPTLPAGTTKIYVTVKGSHHATETVKATFNTGCTLAAGATGGNSYIQFKVTAVTQATEFQVCPR